MCGSMPRTSLIGRIKSGRIVKRASGWYLCLFIDALASGHSCILATGAIGMDPGFHHLLTLSTGEKIPHPHELRQTARPPGPGTTWWSEASGGQTPGAACQSTQGPQPQTLSTAGGRHTNGIVWSKDRQTAIAKVFGKSVASAGHAQLRGMLAYKCTASGRQFLEVPSKYSTRTCSACGSLSGPTGYAGLSVRQWTCVSVWGDA